MSMMRKLQRPPRSATTLRMLAVAALGMLLGACTGLTPLGSRSSSVPVEPPMDASEGAADYRIGPGDVLSVFVWRQPELSVSVPVRPDGKVSTPLVEDLVAVGRTPTELAREIEVVLGEYIRSPQVNVIVQNFVGTFGEQIRVLGQAVQPRAVPYRDRMTLMDVLIEVGGLTQFAAGNRSRVVRSVGDETHEIRVRLDDLINRGRIEHNIAMQPGDVIIIPEALF